MSTVVQTGFETQSKRARRLILDLQSISLWLVASSIAAFFALLIRDSAVVGDEYIPVGNDSFYHARRILDAALGTHGGFYQFDDRLHVPEGSWVPWPWAYDYLLAKATQVALWVAPALDPMAFIAYVPVAWILVNAALFLAAARATGLSRDMQALAMLCFAFSPLTQLLHATGMIDHHYVEHTFVLLTVWLGLRWFQQPNAVRRAVLLGVTLGVATAFHNGLFILQLFPLATVFILWLRHSAPGSSALRGFGIALIASTLLVLLPSAPFRSGMWEFGLHSWFHLYIATCTALAMAFMGWLPASRKTFAGLTVLCLALAIPLAQQVVGAAGFLSGGFSILTEVTEVRSPYRMFTDTMGPMATLAYYSGLLLLAPVVVIVYAYRTAREQRAERLYLAVAITLGVTLLLDQMRLHYFGYFGLVVGTLLVVEELRQREAWHRGLVFVATFGALALAFQPPLNGRLLVPYALSADPEYADAYPLFMELGQLCAEEPGTVLASTDDGNPILFHSDCSVIANNFILRADDKTHIDEINRLMQLSAEQIRTQRPDVKYLLLRARDFSLVRNGVAYLVAENAVAKQFLIDETPPPGFALVRTIRSQADENGNSNVYAKLFKVAE
jgi:hypothetical protein